MKKWTGRLGWTMEVRVEEEPWTPWEKHLLPRRASGNDHDGRHRAWKQMKLTGCGGWRPGQESRPSLSPSSRRSGGVQFFRRLVCNSFQYQPFSEMLPQMFRKPTPEESVFSHVNTLLLCNPSHVLVMLPPGEGSHTLNCPPRYAAPLPLERHLHECVPRE